MRSSKSRSRSKTNRPRTLGNIINRVFDSSGPEGKVRGTPQQLIEKYQQLGRDAQLSNDRVAAENFMQHSEHYTRLLGEAMREMAAEQEVRQAQQPAQGAPYNNQNQRSDRPEYRNDRGDGAPQPRFDQPRNDQQRNDQQRNDQQRNDQPRNDQQRNDQPRNDQSRQDQQRNDQPRQDRRPDYREERRDDRRVTPSAVLDFPEVDQESSLVETPEARRLPVDDAVAPAQVAIGPDADMPPGDETAKRSRGPRRPRAGAEPALASDPAPEKVAKPRGPAKPREAAE